MKPITFLQSLALILLSLGFASATAQTAPRSSAMGAKLAAFLERVNEDDLRLNPQARLARGDYRYAGEYGDLITDEYFSAAEKTLRKQLADAKAINRAALNPKERIAFDTWQYLAEYTLKSYTAGFSRISRQLPIDHLFGAQVAFQQVASGNGPAPFATVKDYEDGLARIDGFVLYLDRAIVRMREGLAASRVQPLLVTKQVIAQVERVLAAKVEDSPFFAPVNSMPASIPAADRERLGAAYRKALNEKIYPAYTRLRGFLRDAYLPAGRDHKPGLAGMRDGAAYYDYVTESFTTIPVKSGEVHALGLREVARIRKEMEAIKVKVGFRGSLTEFFTHVRTDPKFRFESREAVLQRYREISLAVEAASKRLFHVQPKAALEIKPYPPEQESSGGGAYYLIGTPDGKRPGTFYINLGNLEDQTSPRATALYLHEGTPGHHMQGSLAQEDTDLPPVLRFTWNPGFGEGWALYAEWLGFEMGLYADPMQHFGRLDMEIFRAARLVVDTGLHAKGWSRDQAVQYLRENTSLPHNIIEQEVDRYIVWPGQAVSYKVGELFIRRLRAKAEQALGKNFDVRDFHAQVLNTGALPLRVLERKIDDWIAAARRAR